MGKRPESLKDKIIVEWLDLNPDTLAAGIQLEMFSTEGGQSRAYVSLEAIADYAAQNETQVFEAFTAYKAAHTTDRAGYAYAWDWHEFLDSLRKARAIAAEPFWEPPNDGVVYHCLA